MTNVLETRLSSNGTLPAPPAPEPVRRRLPPRAILWVGLALALGILAAFGLWWRANAATPPPLTQPVSRGTLVQTITASGTVNPRDTISVGTQVSGTVAQLFVDYNSKVRVGQVLAKLDPSALQTAVDQASAQVAQAQAQVAAAGAGAQASADTAVANGASVQQAQANLAASASGVQSNQAAVQAADANVVKAASALSVARSTVARDRQLFAGGYVAQNQVDTDGSTLAANQAAYDGAVVAAQQARLTVTSSQQSEGATRAQVAAQSAGADAAVAQAAGAQATIAADRAVVANNEAQLRTAQINLERSVITSPVDGTVIARNVSVGQTVAASFQTPTLFTIARNLKQMEVDLAVGEPDIGHVRPGESIDFTVLAYPDQTFHGTVAELRQNPTVQSNVVTYTVVTYVANSAGQLLPGMTANASVHVAKAQDALLVPLAALQWKPQSPIGGTRRHTGSTPPAGTPASAPAATQNSAGSGSPWGQTGAAGTSIVTAGSDGVVFVSKAGTLRPVRVHVDLVQGTQAAVTSLGRPLAQGDQVAVAEGAGGRSSSQRSGGAGAGQAGLGRALR